jgi:hypothetical protein
MLDGGSNLVVQRPADAARATRREPGPRFHLHSRAEPTFGQLDLRTNWKNVSGNITRLRFRIIDISTFPAPSGFADLRPLTSSSVVIAADTYPCSTGTSSLTVLGTTSSSRRHSPTEAGSTDRCRPGPSR